MKRVIEILSSNKFQKDVMRAMFTTIAGYLAVLILLPTVAIITVWLYKINVGFIVDNKKLIYELMLKANAFFDIITHLVLRMILIYIAALILSIIALFKVYLKITDMLTCIKRTADYNQVLEDGTTIKKRQIIFELHFGSVKSILKNRKYFTGTKAKMLWLRKKEIEGILTVIDWIEENKNGFNENSIFSAASHLVTEKVIKTLGGISPKKRKLMLHQKINTYVTIAMMIIASMNSKQHDYKLLNPRKTVFKANVCYFKAKNLIDKKTELIERLIKINEMYTLEYIRSKERTKQSCYIKDKRTLDSKKRIII